MGLTTNALQRYRAQALLAGIAAERDTQLLVEVVGDRKEVTVLISDGEVLEDRTDGRHPATGIA